MGQDLSSVSIQATNIFTPASLHGQCLVVNIPSHTAGCLLILLHQMINTPINIIFSRRTITTQMEEEAIIRSELWLMCLISLWMANWERIQTAKQFMSLATFTRETAQELCFICAFVMTGLRATHGTSIGSTELNYRHWVKIRRM